MVLLAARDSTCRQQARIACTPGNARTPTPRKMPAARNRKMCTRQPCARWVDARACARKTPGSNDAKGTASSETAPNRINWNEIHERHVGVCVHMYARASSLGAVRVSSVIPWKVAIHCGLGPVLLLIRTVRLAWVWRWICLTPLDVPAHVYTRCSMVRKAWSTEAQRRGLGPKTTGCHRSRSRAVSQQSSGARCCRGGMPKPALHHWTASSMGVSHLLGREPPLG